MEQLFLKYKDYDKFYVTSGAIKDRRDYIENLWKIFEPYSNKHFLKEYKLSGKFHSRTWEMYMGVALIRNGLTIETPKKDQWPDFTVNQDIYVECVTCQNALRQTDPDYVPTTIRDGKVHTVPREQILMHITSSIYNKYNDYTQRVKDQCNKRKPFIIALNSGILQHQSSNPPEIYSALFGFNCLEIQYKRQGLETCCTGLGINTRNKIFKKETSPIEVNLFMTSKYKEISAVIFSDKTIVNTPKEIGTYCYILFNPHATKPVLPSLFPLFQTKEDIVQKLERVRLF